MIVIIDNYDSFVFNIACYFQKLGEAAEVIRNDAVSVRDVVGLKPRAIVISPGPCTPIEAGISTAVVRELSGRVPILGICLGHQCIGSAFGGWIGQQIMGMQGATQESVGAIAGISRTIERLSEISSTIASAVEEQGSATQEISRNVQQAAQGTQQVSSNVSDVQRGTRETGSASSIVLSLAQALSAESRNLREEMSKFLASVRAA